MTTDGLTIEGLSDRELGLQPPLVSVVILNQNYARFVGAAIDSIRQQNYPHFECLVFDNASTDDSRSVISRHINGDPRFSVLHLDKNYGIMGAWQKALDLVRGEFVTFLDSDDVKFSNFISSHVQVHLALRLGIGFTSSRVVEIDAEGRVIVGSNLGFGFNPFDKEPRGLQPRDKVPRISTISDAEYDVLNERTTQINPQKFGWYWAPTSANVYRRSVMLLARPNIDASTNFLFGDVHFCQLCHILSGSAVIDRTLSAYRIHGASGSNKLPSMFYMRTAKKEVAEASKRQRQVILRILLSRVDSFSWIIKDRYWLALDQQSGESGDGLKAYYADPTIQKIFAEYLVQLTQAFGFDEVMGELGRRIPSADPHFTMLGAWLAGAPSFAASTSDVDQYWTMIDWCTRDHDIPGFYLDRPEVAVLLVEKYNDLVAAFGERQVLTQLRKRYRTRAWWSLARRARRGWLPPIGMIEIKWKEIYQSVSHFFKGSTRRSTKHEIMFHNRVVDRVMSPFRSSAGVKSKATDIIDYGDLGLRDAIRTGWFRSETGELFKDFPIVRSDTVLDIGCGDGGMAGYCSSLGARVIAIDSDSTKIATAQQRLRSQNGFSFSTIIGSADALPIKSESADKIICTEVLEHVDDPAKVLSEIVRVGKQGARYILSVPDAASERVLKRLAPASAYEKPNHIRIIERNEFERMVSAAGLTVEAHAYYSFYWAVWNAIVWKCNIDFHKGRHPALDNWARTWNAVLKLPEGKAVQDALNMVMPKNQVIIARKP